MPTDLNGKPFQLTFVRSSQMIMFANVLCEPPLGQSTVILAGQSEARQYLFITSNLLPLPKDMMCLWIPYASNSQWLQVNFAVVIESSISFPEQPWEAVIWHNCDSEGTWAALSLQNTEPQPRPVSRCMIVWVSLLHSSIPIACCQFARAPQGLSSIFRRGFAII